VKASPLARKIADALGVRLAGLQGTGPGGRIIAFDVENAPVGGPAPAAGGSSPVPAILPTPIAGMPENRVPLSGMRRVIAERLLASKTQIPHFYLTIEIDAAPMMAFRKEYIAASGGKITFNDIALAAVARAAMQKPKVNAAFAGDAIIEYGSVNLSVAIAVEDGLVTPVIRDAQKLSLKEISASVKDLALRARDKKLKPEEYAGGTITVSNLGSYGIEQFCAIVNPPQAAILAVGAIVKKPVVNERDEIGDNLVPDYMTSVTPGAFYGWPYSYYGQHVDSRPTPPRPDLVARAIAPDYALGAHTASLGLAFYRGDLLPTAYRGGVFIGQHGSWNRSVPSGYKVIFIRFKDGHPVGLPQDVLSGFLDDKGQAMGRPVGVAIDPRGALLVADDVGGVVWRVTPAAP